MATRGKVAGKVGGKKGAAKVVTKASASVGLAKRGVQSSEDYRGLLCALMTDVIQGNISPEIANAATNAGRALVRMVELEYKMAAGRKSTGNGRGLLMSRRIAEAA